MKIKGKLLDFDRVDSLGYKFSPNCEITYPEKLPIIWNFETSRPEYVLGTAKVIRTETGLEIEGELTNTILNYAIMNGDGIPGIGLGGFYSALKTSGLKGQYTRVVDYAYLRNVSITPSPVFKDYTFEVVKEEE